MGARAAAAAEAATAFVIERPRSSTGHGSPAGQGRLLSTEHDGHRGGRAGRRAVIGGLAAGLLAATLPAFGQAPSVQAPSRAADGAVKIQVEAHAIAAFDARSPELRRFGAVDFLGGLELTSPYRDFGGLSALRVLADGEHFVALSDRARWLTGRLVYSDGRPSGIADAAMAPMLGPDGKALTARGWYDTESLTADGDVLYVGIERVHRIVRFDFGRSGVLAHGEPIAVPPGFSALPANKGIEALAFVPAGQPLAGTLIAVSERGLDRAGNIRAFLIGGPTPGEFSVKRSDEFDISDCALLPSGDLILLERRFTWTSGVAIRLRRVAAAAIRPGALVDGPVLLFADMGYQIDNMEGLAIHRNAAGDVLLTLISDDNFSILQRTLLLQFRLVGE